MVCFGNPSKCALAATIAASGKLHRTAVGEFQVGAALVTPRGEVFMDSIPNYRKVSSPGFIAGCFRFFTLIQCFDRPA